MTQRSRPPHPPRPRASKPASGRETSNKNPTQLTPKPPRKTTKLPTPNTQKHTPDTPRGTTSQSAYRASAKAAASPVSQPERIAKRIAAAGVCSRREAERLIAEGKVTLNGVTVETPATLVTPHDDITVNHIPLAEKPALRLWLYHKPKGLVTTHRDPEGRDTVFQHLPPELGHVISIGRLDLQSEGLLLLTNNGELARYLELPQTGWIRKYRVRLFGKPTQETLYRLQQGVTIDGIRYGSIVADVTHGTKTNGWVDVTLTEGKNRELRRVFEHFGHPISRLIRLGYGPFQLGDLPRGAIREVHPKQLRSSLPQQFLGR